MFCFRFSHLLHDVATEKNKENCKCVFLKICFTHARQHFLSIQRNLLGFSKTCLVYSLQDLTTLEQIHLFKLIIKLSSWAGERYRDSWEILTKTEAFKMFIFSFPPIWVNDYYGLDFYDNFALKLWSEFRL